MPLSKQGAAGPRKLLIRGARQLLTLRGPSGPRRGSAAANLAIIPDGALLIADGRIIEVGPSRRVENLEIARTADVIEAAGCVVMPGFVDSAAHLVHRPADFQTFPASEQFSIERYFADGANVVANATPRTVMNWARTVARSALSAGTTSIDGRSGAAIEHSGERKILRTMAALRAEGYPVVATLAAGHAAPAAEDPQAAFADLVQAVSRRKLAAFACWIDTGLYPEEACRRFLSAAASRGLAAKVRTRAAMAAEALQAGASAIEGLEDGTMSLADSLASAPVLAVLTPAVGFHLGTRQPDARLLIDRGAAVALASGYGYAGSHCWNMQAVQAIACRQLGMSPAEAVTAATINGACALGVAYRTGSIEPGRDADLLILRTRDYRDIAYEFGGNLVRMVMSQGECVYDDREPESF